MKKKVLIVEDDLNIQALERDYLESNSFIVETAADGKTGLEMAMNEDYDLILLVSLGEGSFLSRMVV